MFGDKKKSAKGWETLPIVNFWGRMTEFMKAFLTSNGVCSVDMLKQQQWQALEQRLGYVFIDRKLLQNAFCHRSFANEHPEFEIPDNERLEFLGDAVLDLIAAQQLLEIYPDRREGELTRIRAELVAETSLVRLATKLKIGECLLLGRGEDLSGGSTKPGLLADTLEALFGAIFLDGGYGAASKVIAPLLRPVMSQVAMHAGQDYKTRLQEYLQTRNGLLPVYRLSSSEGPDHDRIYHVEVLVDGEVYGFGQGRTKKKAEQVAAKTAMSKLGME